MATLTVEVTQADIDVGKPENCRLCPVALALKRATGMDWWVDTKFFAKQTFRNDFIKTPTRVAAFIRRFDRTHHGKPFHFRLEIHR